MQQSPLVTVAIPAWTTPERLAASLYHLRPDAEAGRARVLVLGPVPGAAGLDWVRVVEPGERPATFGAAADLLSSEVATPWLAIGNVDVTLEPDTLQRLLAAGERDPRVAVLVPRVLAPGGGPEQVARPFPGVRQAMLQASHLGRRIGGAEALPWSWDPDRPRDVPWAYASFLLVRRAALSAVGGWTADLPEHAVELDLCWRLSLGGWGVRYEPGAAVRRQDGAVPRAAFGDRHQDLDMRAEWAFLRRRRGPAVTAAVAAVATGHSALRAAVWSATAPAGARALRARADLRAKREALAVAAERGPRVAAPAPDGPEGPSGSEVRRNGASDQAARRPVTAGRSRTSVRP
jgi:N-acetylglucosaminyl-diphospho-decaprenol L-rhamnosyltransferase